MVEPTSPSPNEPGCSKGTGLSALAPCTCSRNWPSVGEVISIEMRAPGVASAKKRSPKGPGVGRTGSSLPNSSSTRTCGETLLQPCVPSAIGAMSISTGPPPGLTVASKRRVLPIVAAAGREAPTAAGGGFWIAASCEAANPSSLWLSGSRLVLRATTSV